MRKIILLLCFVVACIAACSKKNSPAPETHIATADTSIKTIDTSTYVAVIRYYGTSHYAVDSVGGGQIPDTSFADSAFAIITSKGTDTTTEFKHRESSPTSGWNTIRFKGYVQYYTNGQRNSQTYWMSSDALSISINKGSFGAVIMYSFGGIRQ